MTVTNESGGRLNAFANEPQIDIIASDPSKDRKNQIFVIIVSLALIISISSKLDKLSIMFL